MVGSSNFHLTDNFKINYDFSLIKIIMILIIMKLVQTYDNGTLNLNLII